MTAPSPASLAATVRRAVEAAYYPDESDPYEAVKCPVLSALDALVALAEAAIAERDAVEREWEIRDRAMTDYFVDASLRAEAAEADVATMMERYVVTGKRQLAAEARVAELEKALRVLESALRDMTIDDVPFTDWSANVGLARNFALAALRSSTGGEDTCTTT